MKTVLRHLISIDRETSLALPEDARVILVGTQPDRHFSTEIVIWTEHSFNNRGVSEMTDGSKVMRRIFQVFGTGKSIPDRTSYCGSCVAGEYVWHVYEWNMGK